MTSNSTDARASIGTYKQRKTQSQISEKKSHQRQKNSSKNFFETFLIEVRVSCRFSATSEQDEDGLVSEDEIVPILLDDVTISRPIKFEDEENDVTTSKPIEFEDEEDDPECLSEDIAGISGTDVEKDLTQVIKEKTIDRKSVNEVADKNVFETETIEKENEAENDKNESKKIKVHTTKFHKLRVQHSKMKREVKNASTNALKSPSKNPSKAKANKGSLSDQLKKDKYDLSAKSKNKSDWEVIYLNKNDCDQKHGMKGGEEVYDISHNVSHKVSHKNENVSQEVSNEVSQKVSHENRNAVKSDEDEGVYSFSTEELLIVDTFGQHRETFGQNQEIFGHNQETFGHIERHKAVKQEHGRVNSIDVGGSCPLKFDDCVIFSDFSDESFQSCEENVPIMMMNHSPLCGDKSNYSNTTTNEVIKHDFKESSLVLCQKNGSICLTENIKPKNDTKLIGNVNENIAGKTLENYSVENSQIAKSVISPKVKEAVMGTKKNKKEIKYPQFGESKDRPIVSRIKKRSFRIKKKTQQSKNKQTDGNIVSKIKKTGCDDVNKESIENKRRNLKKFSSENPKSNGIPRNQEQPEMQTTKEGNKNVESLETGNENVKDLTKVGKWETRVSKFRDFLSKFRPTIPLFAQQPPATETTIEYVNAPNTSDKVWNVMFYEKKDEQPTCEYVAINEKGEIEDSMEHRNRAWNITFAKNKKKMLKKMEVGERLSNVKSSLSSEKESNKQTTIKTKKISANQKAITNKNRLGSNGIAVANKKALTNDKKGNQKKERKSSDLKDVPIKNIEFIREVKDEGVLTKNESMKCDNEVESPPSPICLGTSPLSSSTSQTLSPTSSILPTPLPPSPFPSSTSKILEIISPIFRRSEHAREYDKYSRSSEQAKTVTTSTPATTAKITSTPVATATSTSTPVATAKISITPAATVEKKTGKAVKTTPVVASPFSSSPNLNSLNEMKPKSSINPTSRILKPTLSSKAKTRSISTVGEFHGTPTNTLITKNPRKRSNTPTPSRNSGTKPNTPTPSKNSGTKPKSRLAKAVAKLRVTRLKSKKENSSSSLSSTKENRKSSLSPTKQIESSVSLGSQDECASVSQRLNENEYSGSGDTDIMTPTEEETDGRGTGWGSYITRFCALLCFLVVMFAVYYECQRGEYTMNDFIDSCLRIKTHWSPRVFEP